jgi:dihydroorotase (multifunctional complex type)
MLFDTVVRDATLIVPGAPRVRGDVGVRDGKIAAVASPGSLPEGSKTIAAGGRPLLPGVIDAHTHLGYWGEFEREMETETLGAAVGGVTTAILMLKMKNLPPRLAEKPSYLDIFDDFRSIVEHNSTIDMLFRPYPLTERHMEDIPAYVSRLGARGFKFIMHFPRGGLEAEMSGAYALGDGMMLDAFRRVGVAGGIAVVHAENQCIIDLSSARLQAAGREDLVAWSCGRPHLSEVEAIQRSSLLAHSVGCPTYIAHVSSAESVDFIRKARDEGRMIRAETCPHYLTLTHDDSIGKLAKQKPPIRGRESQERLWWGIEHGVIDVVSSDHMPSRFGERKTESIWTCQWGFPSIETLLPLMLSEGVHAGRISLERLVEVCCLNPARIFGLYPQKGHMGIGADADLVLVDLEKRAPIRQRDFPSSSDFSLYEGRDVVGWPVLTMVRGRIVMRDGKVTAKGKGGGRYVPQTELQL